MKEFYNLSSNSDEDTLTIAINDDIGSFFGNDSDSLSKILKANPDVKNIKVEINTDGGSLFDGISMFNQLQVHPAHVETVITGVAASAGSLIFMAGDTRTFRTGAFLMIHKPMSIGINNADEMRDKADQLDKFQRSLVNIYESKVTITREEINSLVDKETWLEADEAIEKGFATGQSDVKAEVVNKYDYCEYFNKHTAAIPKDAKKYFKNQGKHKIQQVLNTCKNILLNINPNDEDDMDEEKINALLAENSSKLEATFSSKIGAIETDFTNKMAKKDEMIDGLKTQITELNNKSALNSIENIVDGFVNSGKVALKDKAAEIKNLKFRESDAEEFTAYKNSLNDRDTLVDFTPDFANNSNGAPRSAGSLDGDLDTEITNMLAANNLTITTANSAQLKNAAAKAREKISGGK